MVETTFNLVCIVVIFWILSGQVPNHLAAVGVFFRDTWLESKRLRVQELSERRKLAELERE